ncbi:hypothetical protein LCGC14_2818710, partial [marine sediment metagenome]
AILTGDRSGMGRDTLQALRDSNLAHLLAISGLHMGLLTGVVFSALRFALALIPALALGHPVKKYAAVGALLAGAGYLALSGGNVATQRAYIMVAVVLGAVLLDRRALTLRGVALAATIVLVLRPEALTGPGFQMSFAATTALIAVFRLMRDSGGPRAPRLLQPVLALVVSSGVAGAATAPIAAAHFNQIAKFGLVANLLSVPLMGTLVMPAAVLAAAGGVRPGHLLEHRVEGGFDFRRARDPRGFAGGLGRCDCERQRVEVPVVVDADSQGLPLEGGRKVEVGGDRGIDDHGVFRGVGALAVVEVVVRMPALSHERPRPTAGRAGPPGEVAAHVPVGDDVSVLPDVLVSVAAGSVEPEHVSGLERLFATAAGRLLVRKRDVVDAVVPAIVQVGVELAGFPDGAE